MTRTVARRIKPAPIKSADATTALCGWCIGPAGAILPHNNCLGKRLTTFICTCKVCGYLPPPKESKS